MTTTDSPLDRLTDRTRKVLSLAATAARRRGAPRVQAADVLMGILEEGGGVAVAVLHQLEVDPETLSRAATRRCPAARPDTVEFADEPPADLLAAAVAAGQELGHFYIGTEHLLVALMRESGGMAEALTEVGVTERAVVTTVARLLGRQR